MTTESELKRVRGIHGVLDEAAAFMAKHGATDVGKSVVAVWAWVVCETWGPRYEFAPGTYEFAFTGVDLVEGPEAIRFTVDEVKAWPEMKAKMIARLHLGYSFSCMDEVLSTALHGEAPASACVTLRRNIERGLCLYREMLTDAPKSKPQVSQDSPYLITGGGIASASFVAEVTARAYEQIRKGQHVSLRTKGGSLVIGVAHRYTASNLTAELEIAKKQQAADAARASKVATLRRELDRSVGHPSEARSERALPNANGVKRWP